MPDPTICLQMMVKDEAETIEKAITSIMDVCDEIIIGVDRASTDDTYKIASKYATTLWEFDFNDDFANIRNQGIEMMSSDWFIVIDGHEYYHEGHDRMLAEIIRKAHPTDFRLIGHPVWFELDEYGNALHIGGGQRILRSDVRYVHAQHNHPNVNDQNERVWMKDVALVHDRPSGLEEDRKEQRDDIMPKYMLTN